VGEKDRQQFNEQNRSQNTNKFHNFFSSYQNLRKMLFFALLIAVIVVFSTATQILESDRNIMAISPSMIDQINVRFK
jgi:hypothetical protein